MPRLIDITGHRFGKLTVIRRSTQQTNGRYLWICDCDCGKRVIKRVVKTTKSCGCTVKEWGHKLGTNPEIRARALATQKKKWVGVRKEDRQSESIEYRTWKRMKTRCYWTSSKDYKDYGARGIIICDRWKHSFANFLGDMGLRPEGKYSIDRIDNNGNYEPSNCRWATDIEQASNRRGTRPITVFGIQYPTFNAACAALNIPRCRAYNRVQRGWSLEEAFVSEKQNKWSRRHNRINNLARAT